MIRRDSPSYFLSPTCLILDVTVKLVDSNSVVVYIQRLLTAHSSNTSCSHIVDYNFYRYLDVCFLLLPRTSNLKLHNENLPFSVDHLPLLDLGVFEPPVCPLEGGECSVAHYVPRCRDHTVLTWCSPHGA